MTFYYDASDAPSTSFIYSADLRAAVSTFHHGHKNWRRSAGISPALFAGNHPTYDKYRPLHINMKVY